MRLNYFEQYKQEERDDIKSIIRAVYGIYAREINSEETLVDKSVMLSNIVIADIKLPEYITKDINTFKDVIAYSEWVILHWAKVKDYTVKENKKIIFKEDVLRRRLQVKIKELRHKEFDLNRMPTKFKSLYIQGKGPDKIRLDMVTRSNYAAINQYLNALEVSVI